MEISQNFVTFSEYMNFIKLGLFSFSKSSLVLKCLRKLETLKPMDISAKFVRVDWAREPKCYICAMGNYKPHHVIILSHFQFHSIHYKTEEPGCRWADKQLVSVRITYQKWGQIMYEVEFEILKTSSF